MIFSGRSLDDISLDDICLLVEHQVPKGPHLEYKETPYGGRPQDKCEMLRDISALANSEGGYLIIGIREDYAGRAAELTPVPEPQLPIKSLIPTRCVSPSTVWAYWLTPASCQVRPVQVRKRGVCPMWEAIKLKARVRPDRRLEIPRLPPGLPEGEVELILLYERKQAKEDKRVVSPLAWPVLDGGRYLGGTLRREEIYGDRGR